MTGTADLAGMGRGRDEAADRREIRDLIENWVVFRDSGDWKRLRPLWHPDGRMVATWTEGSADEFIAMSQAGWAKGMTVLHRLGGSSIDLVGDRALVQTKMTITQRAPVEGVMCDVTCAGRFYDFLDRRAGRWGLVLRQSIYELDRLDPVVPGTFPVLDMSLLEQFPIGYRHLAYLQTRVGFDVTRNLAGLRGPEVTALYERGAAWLANALPDPTAR